MTDKEEGTKPTFIKFGTIQIPNIQQIERERRNNFSILPFGWGIMTYFCTKYNINGSLHQRKSEIMIVST